MKGLSESMQQLDWHGLAEDGGDEGLHEHWAGQDVLQFLCVETKKAGMSSKSKMAADPFLRLLAGSETQETPSTLHQGSVFATAKRQRKGYKPARVPPTCENSLPTLEKCVHVGDQQQKESSGSPVPVMEKTALMEQQPGASLPTSEKTTHLGKQKQKEMKKLETPLPNMGNFSLIQKWQQNGMEKLESPLLTTGNFAHLVTQQQNGMKIVESSLPAMGNYALTDKKLLNGTKKHEMENSTPLHNPQQHEKKFGLNDTTVCMNVACKAQLSSGASFCRRCSCCICKLFDDNKDPSLWIPCNTEMGGCGLSCHIECALKHGVAGVVISNGSTPPLDGSYFCQSCGTITPLIGFWKKQLQIAKDARRVDIFQHRLLLSHRLLKGTKWHNDAHGPIDEAVRKLEAEVGQMAAGSAKLARCIVNRLSCNVEVQNLISLALEKVDTPSLDSTKDTKHAGHNPTPCSMCFGDVSSSSIVVTINDDTINMKAKLLGYKLWHRRASESSYPCNPTCIISSTNKKFVVSNLHPHTEYTFKVVPFSMEGDLAECEAGCSTKGVEEIETPVNLYSSLDVVLINARKVGEGTSRCINEVFDLNYNMDGFKSGFKVQDFEDVLVDQHKRVCNMSLAFPSTPMEQKKDADSFDCLSSPSYAKTHAISSIQWGGRQLACSNTSGVHQDRNLHSIDGPIEVTNTAMGNVSMRKSPCVYLGSQDEEPPRVSYPCSSELENRNKQVFLLDTVACLHNTSVNCPSMGKTSTTEVVECDHPSQSWVMQVHGEDKGIRMNTQVGMGIVGAHDHMEGVINCSGEAEFNNYEFSVKVIRWLECEGHLKEEFRMKFLTWYTLRATEHEKKVVSVFIDTLQDDPASLAGQLVDAFEDLIAAKRQPMTADGYCRRLW